jgi:hypothetical protein
MKNLVLYYFQILLPLPVLIWASFTDSTMFVVLLFAYYIYRGFVDGQRLYEKGVIEKKERWKILVIPFYSSSFFKQLYFER